MERRMKRYVGITVGLVAGIVIGAVGSRSTIAQKSPMGYVIGEIDVTNQQDYSSYGAGVPATLAKYGGRFLVRGGKTQSLEGEPPKRIVVLAFDTPEAAARWYASPEYSAIKPIRQRASKSRLFTVEGVTP
jgi:uncharacterized protein (DUF1330 family)